MSDKEINSMEDALNGSYGLTKISQGEILKGKVIKADEKEVTVNINYSCDELIKREEVSASDRNPAEILNTGDEIDVMVLSTNDGDGFVELSLKRAESIKEQDEIENAFNNELPLKVNVTRVIKGGLEAYYKNIRVFIPGSQASRIKKPLEEFEGKELEIKLIDFDYKNNALC